jgi:hypothetical protein
MADIVNFKGERQKSNEDVIHLLEQVLEEAKEGRIVAVGLAVVRPSSNVNCCFTDFDNAGLLMGAAAMLQARLIANLEPHSMSLK